MKLDNVTTRTKKHGVKDDGNATINHTTLMILTGIDSANAPTAKSGLDEFVTVK